MGQEYHANAKAFLEAGFCEKQIKRETKTFAHSVQVWSTYEKRMTADGPVTGRGTNNIMLSFDGKRYWILAEPGTTKARRIRFRRREKLTLGVIDGFSPLMKGPPSDRSKD